MSSMYLDKSYVDRGVQTMDADLFPLLDFSTTNLANISRFSDLPNWSSTPANAPARSFPNAYINTFRPQNLIPGQLAAPTRRVLKQPQLPYNRPSQTPTLKETPGTRITSLPETIPIYSVSLPKTRVVSMPDNVTELSSKPGTNSGSASEQFEHSVTTENSYLSIEAAIGVPRVRISTARRSETPHTPSPPSSPESIMIIGNNSQVQKAFLAQKAPMSQAQLSSNGWVTWANSPPRPIPALHGPLSLPYARCPSGAEGTIVEGPADLSRTVWGADSTSTRETSHQMLLKSNGGGLATPLLKDLNLSSLKLASSNTVGAQQNERYTQPNLQTFNMEGGLGISWKATPGSRPFGASAATVNETFRSDMLKPSAPAFIPRFGTQTAERTQLSPISLASRSVVKAPAPPRRMSAIEIAQQYRKQQDGGVDAIPTPPTSSSAQWNSPHVQTQTADLPSVQDLLRQQLKVQAHLDAQLKQLDIHRRQLEAQQEKQILAQRQIDAQRMHAADQLRFRQMDAEVSAQRQQQLQQQQQLWQHHKQQHFARDDTRYLPLTPLTPFSEPEYHSNDLTATASRPNPKVSLPNAPVYDRTATAIAMSNPQYNLNGLPPLSTAMPPSPVSPEISTHVSTQQPRSVPMARLMRRRLSSVVEEDAAQYTESAPSPPPSPVKPSVYRNQFSSSQTVGLIREPIGPGSLQNNFARASTSIDGIPKPKAPFARTIVHLPPKPQPLVDLNHSEMQTGGGHRRFGGGDAIKPMAPSKVAVPRAAQTQQVAPLLQSPTMSTKGSDAGSADLSLPNLSAKKKPSRTRKRTGAKSAVTLPEESWLNEDITSPWLAASLDAEAWL